MVNVNIVGTGYIGSVISVYLAKNGKKILALDKNDGILEKREWFNRYDDLESHINSKYLDRIETTTNYDELNGSIHIICINTPIAENSIDLTYLKSGIEDLAKILEKNDKVIVRSTILPGTSQNKLIPVLENISGLERGKDFSYCYSPEFVRGGTGLEDFENPPKQVVAGDNEALDAVKQIFPTCRNRFKTDLRTAEAVKYFDNIFHGLKISLANEAGRLGVENDFDPQKVMDIIASDEKLNMSSQYMDPGAAFGGSCIQKDISALEKKAAKKDVDVPVISAINESNNSHNSWKVSLVEELNGVEKVGIIGISYKSGFNSTAESPGFKVAKKLEKEGFDVKTYDPLVEHKELNNVSKTKIRADSDALLILNRNEEVENIEEDFNGKVIDLASFDF